MDSNRLRDSINAAQQAVQLAPEIGEYHAILGRAYDYSRLSSQAEREYRTALSLDPQNALARAELGLRATNLSTTIDALSQAFLYDPAVSTELLRGGIGTEVAPTGGTEGQRSLNLTHRDSGADGKFHFLGLLGAQPG